MTNALIADALRVAREFRTNFGQDIHPDMEHEWRLAAHYLAAQLEVALKDTGAGFSRLPPQRPTRALKVDKDGPTLAVSKY